MSNSDLFDVRSSLWRSAFDAALPFDAFLEKASPAHRARWADQLARLSLTAHQSALLGSFKRHMNILVLAGAWCGDCATQCPMLELIASATSVVTIRFIDNQANTALRDELRIHGAARVPVAVTLSEDFLEVGRSGDRSLAAYRKKARIEMGDACGVGFAVSGESELAEEVAEWIEYFERHQLLLRVSPFLRRRYND
jgi:hypothetical protein